MNGHIFFISGSMAHNTNTQTDRDRHELLRLQSVQKESQILVLKYSKLQTAKKHKIQHSNIGMLYNVH